jgi:hypothetical protein
MQAMLDQLDPSTVLRRFQKIADAGKNVMATDIPAAHLATFLDLATKARSKKVTSVQFVPPLIKPAFADFGLIRTTVKDTLVKVERADEKQAEAAAAKSAGKAPVKAPGKTPDKAPDKAASSGPSAGASASPAASGSASKSASGPSDPATVCASA